jgi:hypothetical protein
VTTLEILRAARAKIADPKRWTQKAFARNAFDDYTHVRSPDATCWCAQGALKSVDGPLDALCAAATCLSGAVSARSIIDWNDHSTHADVLAGFDAAIVNEEAAS